MEMFDPIAYINEPRWQKVRPGLERITELLERMGRPQDRLKFVHVAGTNGKGSTCAYIASILQEGGYRTGLFTSPYIIEFEERIRVDGRNISLEDLRDVTLFVREHAEHLGGLDGYVARNVPVGLLNLVQNHDQIPRLGLPGLDERLELRRHRLRAICSLFAHFFLPIAGSVSAYYITTASC